MKWTAGSKEDTFLWSGSSASVVLSTKDNDGEAPWLVRLVDADGRTVESESVDGRSEVFAVTEELYSAARASALNIEETIDGLLEDLNPF